MAEEREKREKEHDEHAISLGIRWGSKTDHAQQDAIAFELIARGYTRHSGGVVTVAVGMHAVMCERPEMEKVALHLWTKQMEQRQRVERESGRKRGWSAEP